MSHSLATPPAPTTLRGYCARAWSDPDTRSVTIGLVAVIVFHLLLWLVGPLLLRFDAIPVTARPQSSARDFNIELAPETFAKAPPKPKDPFKFVETNPEAPENTPDKTENFAAQNQQAAQEKPAPDGKSDRAATTGKKDFESNQIVSGRLTQPIEHIPAQPPAVNLPEAEQIVKPARAEQNPLAGTEKVEGENKDGIGANLAKRLESARAVPEKIEGVRDAKDYEGAVATQFAIDPRQPRPRPTIVQQQQTRPAILAEKLASAPNVGPTAIDAKWSNYGAYLQRMIDTVQIQWERLILQQSANPSVGSSVSVKFVMNDQGLISKIVDVESTANETGKRACISAITDRAPYGPWTDDMKAVLGTQQEMTFTFHYQ